MSSCVKLVVVIAVLALAACEQPPPPEPVYQSPPPKGQLPPSPTTTATATAKPATPKPDKAPLFTRPDPPMLGKLGYDLIIEFEVGGRSGYKNRPEWPGGASGVTVGIGYDLGYFSPTVIKQDWYNLPERDRLAGVSGITGRRAQSRLEQVHDIIVVWGTAIEVFEDVDITRTFGQCQRAFPGFDELRPNAQAALVSLVFNRGNSLNGPNRSEMRAIRYDVPRKDYEDMAAQERKMIRVWSGMSIEKGMVRRRYAEAKLIETP